MNDMDMRVYTDSGLRDLVMSSIMTDTNVEIIDEEVPVDGPLYFKVGNYDDFPSTGRMAFAMVDM